MEREQFVPEHIIALQDMQSVEDKILRSDIESAGDAFSLAFDYLTMSIRKIQYDIQYYGDNAPEYLTDQLKGQSNARTVCTQVGRLGELKEF